MSDNTNPADERRHAHRLSFIAHRLSLIGHRLPSLSGWKRNAAAAGLGVLATLALPPFFLFPLLLPAFGGLFLLAGGAATRRRAFYDGWWWGFGHFTTGLYWMCIALLTDPVRFAWLLPFTLIGLNGLIAVYIACMALAFRLMPLRTGPLGVLAFAALWTLVEYARGHWFTGFPWNLIGYAWGYFNSVTQAASVIGVYGLGFATVLAATLPALLLWQRRRRDVAVLACVWLACAASAAWGAYRLQQADIRPFAERYVPDVRLRLVQPNVAQETKWDQNMQMQNLRDQVDLSIKQRPKEITHLVWPETAIPFALNLSGGLLTIFYNAIPDKGALISGTLRAGEDSEDPLVWNSMAIIPQAEGGVRYYDKHHLVPFGEYVPLRGLLPIEKITHGRRDFTEGMGVQTMNVPGAPQVSPLICYEVIFPGRVVDKENRPAWMLNITNDAWFGTSTGPYQHYYMARMRAVEEGLPLVRAANTGISAIVDPFGRAEKSLGLGKQGVVDGRLPQALPEGTTYGRTGDKYLLLLMYGIVLFTLIYPYLRRFRA